MMTITNVSQMTNQLKIKKKLTRTRTRKSVFSKWTLSCVKWLG